MALLFKNAECARKNRAVALNVRKEDFPVRKESRGNGRHTVAYKDVLPTEPGKDGSLVS